MIGWGSIAEEQKNQQINEVRTSVAKWRKEEPGSENDNRNAGTTVGVNKMREEMMHGMAKKTKEMKC